MTYLRDMSAHELAQKALASTKREHYERYAAELVRRVAHAKPDDRCELCGCECVFRRCPCAVSGVFCTACGCDA